MTEANETVQKIGETHPQTLIETLVQYSPAASLIHWYAATFSKSSPLPWFLRWRCRRLAKKENRSLRGMESLSQVMFKLTNYVMKFAPIGVGAAMAHTIGTQGPGVLVSLGNLIFTYYLGLIIFIVFVFGLIMGIIRAPVRQFVRAIREPATIAFATTSSESAMPRAMEAMERLGVPKRIVGFVIRPVIPLISTAR